MTNLDDMTKYEALLADVDEDVLVTSIRYSKLIEAWHWGVWRGDTKMGGWVDTFTEAWNALAPIVELNNFGKETP